MTSGNGREPQGARPFPKSPLQCGWVSSAVGACCEEWRAGQVACGEACRKLRLCGAVRSLFWWCVWGPPPQCVGLPGWEPHFCGNLRSSGSGPCAENRRDILPREGQKKLQLGFLLLRRYLFLFGLEGLQIVGIGPCPPRRVLVVMVSLGDETQVFPFTVWWRQLLRCSWNHRFLEMVKFKPTVS